VPRGRPIEGLHQQLFDATTRILERAGPAGISSRAITTEAGCAKGVLHAHFAGLDDFLVQYVRAVFNALHAQVASFPDRAGTLTVLANLNDLIMLLHGSSMAVAHTLLNADPSLQQRLRHGGSHEGPALDHVDNAIAEYLAAEQRLGRLDPRLDSEGAATAITSTVYRSTFRASPTAGVSAAMVRRVAALVIGEASTAPRP
jgi:AcrR family transcriptional regulator